MFMPGGASSSSSPYQIHKDFFKTRIYIRTFTSIWTFLNWFKTFRNDHGGGNKHNDRDLKHEDWQNRKSNVMLQPAWNNRGLTIEIWEERRSNFALGNRKHISEFTVPLREPVIRNIKIQLFSETLNKKISSQSVKFE